ncbi:ASCH domain protein [Candidatus Tiddalikarchaeum anstoanum]|nr:ASCH domain protein [Candidatus Tiddalikarchaeum anstoanum]
MEVVILSLMQPWAELVVSGKKTIELRKWNTKFRGVFYVHASMKTDIKKCKELGINPKVLANGAVIGKCELVSVKEYNTRKDLFNDAKLHFAPEYRVPCHGFLLKNAERIENIPIKGQLGFFKRNIF